MRMPEVRRRIGARMEAIARAHGMSLTQTARALGEATTTVRQWWAGTRLPPADKMDGYAACFGQEAGYFYGEELARALDETQLGVSPLLWAALDPADREVIRAQVLVWARLRGLAAAPPGAPSGDESGP